MVRVAAEGRVGAGSAAIITIDDMARKLPIKAAKMAVSRRIRGGGVWATWLEENSLRLPVGNTIGTPLYSGVKCGSPSQNGVFQVSGEEAEGG